MSQITKIQLIGDRGSGVDHIHTLIKKNCDLPLDVYYGFINSTNDMFKDTKETLFVFVNRTFTKWAKSYYKSHHSVHYPEKSSFDDLIKNKWPGVYENKEELLSEKNINSFDDFETIFQFRKAKISNHFSVKSSLDHKFTIPYDSVNGRNQLLINQLAGNFKIKMKDVFEDVEYEQSAGFEISADLMSYIASNLDVESEQKVGIDNKDIKAILNPKPTPQVINSPANKQEPVNKNQPPNTKQSSQTNSGIYQPKKPTQSNNNQSNNNQTKPNNQQQTKTNQTNKSNTQINKTNNQSNNQQINKQSTKSTNSTSKSNQSANKSKDTQNTISKDAAKELIKNIINKQNSEKNAEKEKDVEIEKKVNEDNLHRLITINLDSHNSRTRHNRIVRSKQQPLF